jgi:hypothetical protein
MLLATVVLLLFASASAFFTGKLSSRSLMMIQQSPKPSTRSVRRDCGKDSNQPALHLANKLFHLTEMCDDEVMESVVRMCPTGEISFFTLDASSDFKRIKGSWSRSETSLNMVIERTLMVSVGTNPLLVILHSVQPNIYLSAL